MKHFFLIIVFSFISCKGQTIYNLGTTSENRVSDNYYIKDIDNHHDGIVGTWKWQDGNSSFEIILQEFERYSESIAPNQYRDRIFGKYKYIKNGVTIAEVNEIEVFVNSKLTLIFQTPTIYVITIRDLVSSKGKAGDFILTSATTALWELKDIEGIKVGTETGIDFALPTSLTLTKQ